MKVFSRNGMVQSVSVYVEKLKCNQSHNWLSIILACKMK